MPEQPTAKRAKISPELTRRIIILGLKILAVFLSLYILLFRIFGFVRIDTNVMSPSMSGGDLAIIYHLNSDYSIGDTIIYRCGERNCIGRVVAKPGDAVNYNDGKMLVNGRTNDQKAYGNTALPANSTIVYPYNVGQDKLFVLGDNREETEDSRAFGAIDYSEVIGHIIGLFRTHDL
jgi:signal peptidase I